MIEISAEQARQALRGLTIPPRPTILVDLYTRLQRPDANAREIADGIARDVVLSAAVLKTVNSPLYGLRANCVSIQHAVQLLGLSNVTTLVTGVLLRHSMGGKKQTLERFWDSAEKVASISAHIAGTLPGVCREDSYLFGLFRDVGIPMLMQRWPDYKQTLATAARQHRPLPEVEEERHRTSHCVISYLFSKSWGIPQHLREGILRHHDPAVFEPSDTISRGALTLVAINHLAEKIHDAHRRPGEDPTWPHLRPRILERLGLTEGDVGEMTEELAQLAG